MSQPYQDWEFVESRKFDGYQYMILRVVIDGRSTLKGWVYGVNGATWQEAENLENLRSALTIQGRMLS